ncbi:MAG TPA: class I SAM-dependent DNA methyltransferase [Thermoanaerobaculia bacterium]|jgi:type I restriction enzyme M protein|nr:class I SAM-dependent DNA methyltransferase [Thermoanaerobaculia bacterium]
MSDVVQKFWGFCHTLRHDGIDYGDYIEQITYLLFLKMADERAIDLSRMGVPQDAAAAIDCSWPALASEQGETLTRHYNGVLRTLGRQPGLLGDIFTGAASRFNNPANLKRLIDLIDETKWTTMEVDLKAAVFEGLLEKAASEGKKGAGQYFTPRRLIQSIVRCVRPDPRDCPELAICDPACGTAGFLVVAYEWLLAEAREDAEPELARRVRRGTYFGEELVPRPRRLALMNLFLHGLEPEIKLGDSIYEQPGDRRFDVVLTNPPFGNKGANQVPARDDLTIKTSNKQLNFLQHVITLLKTGGRAAVIVPDNCLFADQAGEVFKVLTQECDLHTVLRLPNGTFTPYSAGTKTNVVFFTKGAPTETVWVYDARTNVPRITKKDRPLTHAHLAAFEACYGLDPNGRSRRAAGDSREDRWRSFSVAEVRARDFKIDGLKWLKEESLDDELPEPEELAAEAIAELESAVADLASVIELLTSDAEPQRPRVVQGGS